MKTLLKAAFSQKIHVRWLIYSIITIFGITIANQLEMLTLGVVVNNGSDFFGLFGDGYTVQRSHLDQVWDEIDINQVGEINQADTIRYLSHSSESISPRKLLNQSKYLLMQSEQPYRNLAILLLGVALFKGFFLFFSRYTSKVLGIKISRDLRQRYFEHLQQLPMSFFHKFDIGALSTRITGDANQIALSISSWINNVFYTPITIFVTLLVCFFFSWKLSFIFFFGAPVILIVVRLITYQIKRLTRRVQGNQERFSSIFIDFLVGIQTVKVFCMESYIFDKYKKGNDQIEVLETKMAKYDLITRPILHTVTTYCLISVLLTGLYVFRMPLPQLVVFCGLIFLFYEPIRRFSDENINVQRGVVAAERLMEVLRIQPDIQDAPYAKEIESFTEEIVFDKVSFGYIPDVMVLNEVSFTVKKGETVAIVGATGSGKSTILQLIPRLYNVTSGSITIDGKPLDAYTQKSLRSLISYVPQKPFLFGDSIRENIVFGKELGDQEVIEFSRQAHAHEFISKLEKGYESLVSEMGKNLSGGQQQRIAIARALARQSPILILDEATSSLDSLSEALIKDSIASLSGKITQIIVAHRFSTIEHADKIIYLEEGRVIGEGTLSEMLQTCASFRAQWEAGSLSVASV